MADVARQLVGQIGGTEIANFSLIKGFAVQMTEAQALSLAKHPLVRLVEEDESLSIASGFETYLTDPLVLGSIVTRWYLDRIDQQSASQRLNDTYSWCADGTGIRTYVIDTGIFPAHPRFGGRVDSAEATSNPSRVGLQQFLGNLSPGGVCWTATNHADRYTANSSHGTAVASIIGSSVVNGKGFGVARGVTLVDARTMNCLGDTSSSAVIKTLEWITQQDTHRVSGKSVINMSFSTLPRAGSLPWDQYAVASAIATVVDTYNIPVVIAAGNFNDYVFWYTPSNSARGITVGGTNKDNDLRWVHSNYGHMTVFYAPAQHMESASNRIPQVSEFVTREFFRSELGDCGSPFDNCTSGTSFSAAVMTGVIARHLERLPGRTRDQIVADLQAESATWSGTRVTEPGGNTVPMLVYNRCP